MLRNSVNGKPLRPIRPADIEVLQRDGVVFLPRLIDTDWIARMSAALDRVERRLDRLQRAAARSARDYSEDLFSAVTYLWIRDPDFRAFVFESPVSLIARDLMRCRRTLGLYMDQVFVQKRRSVPSHWHHARAAVPLVGRQFLNIWMPFDPAPNGRGSLAFVVGSHEWDRWFLDEGHYLADRRGRFGARGQYRSEAVPPIDEAPGDYNVVSWDFEPGDAVAFGMNMVHKASGTPWTTVRRRAITTRWWGDDVVYDHRPRQLGPILRAGLRSGEPLDGCGLFPAVWNRAGNRWQRQTGRHDDPSALLRGPIFPASDG